MELDENKGVAKKNPYIKTDKKFLISAESSIKQPGKINFKKEVNPDDWFQIYKNNSIKKPF